MTRRTAASLLLGSLGAASGATIPRQAPEVTLMIPGGAPISLNQYRGKVVILSFVLTT